MGWTGCVPAGIFCKDYTAPIESYSFRRRNSPEQKCLQNLRSLATVGAGKYGDLDWLRRERVPTADLVAEWHGSWSNKITHVAGLQLRTERCCGGQWRPTGAQDRTPQVASIGGVGWCDDGVAYLGGPNDESQPKAPSARQAGKRTKEQIERTSAPRKAGRTTKHDRVLGLLRAKSGITIAAISKATGWQPHSVRGFLAGVVKKKLGLTFTSEKTKFGRIYRIKAKPSTRLGVAAVLQEPGNA